MKKLYEEKSGMIYKLFIYQFAMSLLGLFVASPFKGTTQILAGVFSMLFYFSLVAYAVIEDGQKDHISVSAGRKEGSAYTGFKYALVSYIPTILITVVYSAVSLITNCAESAFRLIINTIIRFFLMGMYLGIESGITGYEYDAVLKKPVSSSPEFVRFLSDNGLFFVIFLVIFPVVCGIAYMLAFNGKVHINTEPKKKKPITKPSDNTDNQ